ncbi:hypothetical protein BC628DRAFT_779873 [Trametes gibbosa]|nr:hypothetical protein BC628DRAFT_779873 [Trametes gibbosa]
MTEYATDPDAIQEYLTARDRTANWVGVHAQGLHFVNPSSPPSTISDDPDAPSYGPSESDSASTHSVPPRMVLRYPDGRPDVPITSDGVPSPTSSTSRRDYKYGPQSSSRQTRSRSGSHAPPPAPPAGVPPPARYAQTLSYASGSRYAPSAHPHITPPRSPESIRVLPSRQPEESQSSARMQASNISSHRSRGPAAQAIFDPQIHQPSIHPNSYNDRVPLLADPLHTSNRSVIAPTPQHPSAQAPPFAAAPGEMAHSHSQPASMSYTSGSRFYEHAGTASRMDPQLPYTYSPPAIVYAPSSRHRGPNYNPPAIVYSPSSHGHHRRPPAPGIAYSRSDPLPHPSQYSPPHTHAGSTPFPSVHGSTSHPSQPLSHRSSQSREDGRARSRTSSAVRGRSSARDMMRDQPLRSRTRSPTPSLSESDTASDTSGSTYYVLPSPGQKVPNSASVYTQKSPRSPSSADSPKRPFLQRLFSRGSGSVDSRGSSSQGKRLLRRHTVGGTHLHPSASPGR